MGNFFVPRQDPTKKFPTSGWGTSIIRGVLNAAGLGFGQLKAKSQNLFQEMLEYDRTIGVWHASPTNCKIIIDKMIPFMEEPRIEYYIYPDNNDLFYLEDDERQYFMNFLEFCRICIELGGFELI